MIEIDKLPDVIGAYSRSKQNSNVYRRGGYCAAVIVLPEGSYVHFGTVSPVGASIKKVPVETNEDVVEVIGNARKP